MDIFMLIMTIVLSVGLFILSIFLLSYYSHTDDKGFGASLVCKIAIVLGMFLSWAQVLCLPLDVSNSRGVGGGFRMDLIWEIIYAATAIYLVFINPALSYYYEAEEDDSFWQKLKHMICYLFASVVITSLILFISYAFLSKAQIPITAASCGLKFVESSSAAVVISASCLVNRNSFLEVDVSFPIYLIGIMSFISWFLFVVFGGVGLTALPMDLIHTFTTRPKQMDKESYDALKSSVISRASQMKSLAESLKKIENENPNIQKATIFNSKKRLYNTDLKRLKANCLVLENDHYILKLQDFFNRQKADLGFVYFYLCLIFGIISSILSLLWIIHILIYIIIKFNGKPLYPFINNLLVWLQESYASFIAVIIFVVFCIYLLLATIKGSIKFGLRFACWTVHPMKKDSTPMNSFLFNINLILITSVSVTQFCAGAFREYATMTDIDLIFGTQIKYLKFFVYFYKYNIFEYAIFGFAILSFIYLMCKPSDRKSLEQYIGDKNGPSEALIESMQSSGLNKY